VPVGGDQPQPCQHVGGLGDVTPKNPKNPKTPKVMLSPLILLLS
jgi:hypothetical protein